MRALISPFLLDGLTGVFSVIGIKFISVIHVHIVEKYQLHSVLFTDVDYIPHQCRPLPLPHAGIVLEPNCEVRNFRSCNSFLQLFGVVQIRREELVRFIHLFWMPAYQSYPVAVLF